MRIHTKYKRYGATSKKLIKDGDFDSNYAYYCLHKLKILPSQFINMSKPEKAFIIASIDFKIEKDKKELIKIKNKNKKK